VKERKRGVNSEPEFGKKVIRTTEKKGGRPSPSSAVWRVKRRKSGERPRKKKRSAEEGQKELRSTARGSTKEGGGGHEERRAQGRSLPLGALPTKESYAQ